ncbi:uncharacterized protein LOC125107027 [Lutra lutra]|uniref:uncharacterized protein LOC125107027 n=1 Tax=Lutra lutra TaxID=9657 RepID=UPI001FD1859A|nr:uncharacterized protein LOC125107027 [Lutra lutra]
MHVSSTGTACACVVGVLESEEKECVVCGVQVFQHRLRSSRGDLRPTCVVGSTRPELATEPRPFPLADPPPGDDFSPSLASVPERKGLGRKHVIQAQTFSVLTTAPADVVQLSALRDPRSGGESPGGPQGGAGKTAARRRERLLPPRQSGGDRRDGLRGPVRGAQSGATDGLEGPEAEKRLGDGVSRAAGCWSERVADTVEPERSGRVRRLGLPGADSCRGPAENRAPGGALAGDAGVRRDEQRFREGEGKRVAKLPSGNGLFRRGGGGSEGGLASQVRWLSEAPAEPRPGRTGSRDARGCQPGLPMNRPFLTGRFLARLCPPVSPALGALAGGCGADALCHHQAGSLALFPVYLLGVAVQGNLGPA